MSTNDLAEALASVSLFHGLPPEQRQQLAASVRVRTYPVGSILFLESDPGDVAYVVLSGSVDLTLMTIEGDQLLLHRVESGGYFGEMALLTGDPRSATATVSTTADIGSIAREDFLSYLQREPETAIQLLRSTFQRLRLADEKIKALGFQDVAGRLARELLSLDSLHGSDEPISVQHEELAQMIASRRPTVSTLLSSWRAAGYITTGRGSVSVKNRSALEELAEL